MECTSRIIITNPTANYSKTECIIVRIHLEMEKMMKLGIPSMENGRGMMKKAGGKKSTILTRGGIIAN